MHYKMTTPCDECPFLKGSGFALKSLQRHASGEFACHKQCDINDDGVYEEKDNGKSAHCAGALIFLEKRGESTQMMRITERLGMYDHTKLNMGAPVGTKPSDFKRAPTKAAS
jgi:hypothetical protein